MEERVFSLDKLARFDANIPQKVVVYQSDKTLGVMWCLEPGQEVFLHQHPNADDVWICLEGESGLYFAGDGQEVEIKKGMAILAKAGQTHGMRNTGSNRFVFIGIAGPTPVDTVKLQK
ncbi:cupin domain-containing protein [Desulfosporosinus sp. PR]|uniref:cupin domain-containing protein n=1 Tax=Candidatus Desulfosporosinus nitrosoreducens TaxID=3401928 RepID=UPI0027E77151|nr:cupin domain-containing protein [Desulfosporosinus sp. PR]MDQ7095242.1 cupin domain-containing protein [Desulfosporosinus sp. PR]